MIETFVSSLCFTLLFPHQRESAKSSWYRTDPCVRGGIGSFHLNVSVLGPVEARSHHTDDPMRVSANTTFFDRLMLKQCEDREVTECDG